MIDSSSGIAVRSMESSRVREGGASLKAIVVREFGAPSVLRFEDVATPEPGYGEVLIKVHTVSVNRTLDCVARAGRYSRPIPLPFTPGTDPAGVIVEVGDGVTGLKIGDRVAAKLNIGGDVEPGDTPRIGGGYAEFAVAGAKFTTIIPDELDFGSATVISRHVPLALTLLRDRGMVQADEWVLVMGAAGGLGSAGVQVGKFLGAKVIAAAGADKRVKVGLDFGADAGVNYRADDLTAELMRITDGHGVDVVFENIGEPTLFAHAFAAMARNGRLVTVGAHGGGGVQLDLSRLYQRGLTITGTTRVNPGDVALSLAAAARGEFRALIDRVLPLSHAAEAHVLVEGRGELGKVILDPTLH
jgi:NADPH2:quinone reductase